MSDERQNVAKGTEEIETDFMYQVRMALEEAGISIHANLFVSQGKPTTMAWGDEGVFLLSVTKISGAVVSQLNKMAGGNNGG